MQIFSPFLHFHHPGELARTLARTLAGTLARTHAQTG